METFIIIIVIAALVFQIWLIVLFVQMASDVRTIKKNIVVTEKKFSLPDVRISALAGEQDEEYKNLIRQISAHLTRSLNEFEYDPSTKAARRISLQKELDNLATWMPILGRELPPELRTIEAFEEYMDINKY